MAARQPTFPENDVTKNSLADDVIPAEFTTPNLLRDAAVTLERSGDPLLARVCRNAADEITEVRELMPRMAEMLEASRKMITQLATQQGISVETGLTISNDNIGTGKPLLEEFFAQFSTPFGKTRWEAMRWLVELIKEEPDVEPELIAKMETILDKTLPEHR